MSEKVELYKPDLKIRLIFSFGILGIFACWVAVMFFSFPFDKFLTYMGLFTAYLLPGAGKESMIPLLTVAGCPLVAIVSGILIIDMALGIIISYNFDLLLKVPFLGRVLAFFTTKTAKLLHDHPWITGLASAGLFLFMYIPFMGSSSINTSIIGRILAIHPKVLLPIIFVGSLCATLTVAVGVKAIINLWLINPWYAVIAVIIAAVVIFGIWKLWKKFVSPKFAKADEIQK